MKEEKFSTAFTKISKQKNLATGRTVMEVENDFIISNIPAKVVTYGNSISYNFLISRDTVNSNFFENLVVKVDSTNIPKAYILKYLLNSNPVFISEHNAYTLSAQTQITQINYNDSESKIEYYDGCTVVTLWCPYKGAHPATQACINEGRGDLYWVRDTSGCGDDLDSGSDGPDPSGNPVDVTGGGGTGGSTDNLDSPHNDSGNNPIVTAPVLELEDEGTVILPCEKLKNGTNSLAYKTKFKNLNTPTNYNKPHETGFFLVGNNYVDGVPNPENDAIEIPSNSKNGTHVHNKIIKNYPETTTTYDSTIKMLSVADLEALIKTFQPQNTDPKDAFAIMASNEGIFAITILEATPWNAELETKLKEFEKYYINRCDYIIANYTTMTAQQRKDYLEKMFLQGLKDKGLENKIGLFEGEVENENDPNINNYNIKWTQKTLKKVLLGYNVKETPCQ